MTIAFWPNGVAGAAAIITAAPLRDYLTLTNSGMWNTLRKRGLTDAVMGEVPDIAEEMDLWTREFLQYSRVEKAESYPEALRKLQEF